MHDNNCCCQINHSQDLAERLKIIKSKLYRLHCRSWSIDRDIEIAVLEQVQRDLQQEQVSLANITE